VATEAAWLNGNNLEKETKKKKEKMKERLDTHRPSHGRSWKGDGEKTEGFDIQTIADLRQIDLATP